MLHGTRFGLLLTNSLFCHVCLQENFEDFPDVVHWIRQVVGILIGIVWGFIPMTGSAGLIRFHLFLQVVYLISFASASPWSTRVFSSYITLCTWISMKTRMGNGHLCRRVLCHHLLCLW